jgi:carboxylesterase type B
MSQDKITLTVADLTINGLSHHGVASFRNLKYAQVAGRWYEARLLDLASQKGVWDATEWGLRAPQTIDVGNAATSHLYPRMSTHDATCEFECLNLNVYAPAAALQAASKDDGLPVIVWMHGGSFEWGDGGSQYGE